MRGLLFAITGGVVLGAALGCHHTAGMCDCDWGPGAPSCVSYSPGYDGSIPPGFVAPPGVPGAPPPAAAGIPIGPPVGGGASPEPIRAMPRAADPAR
jgi:hypothetical protein